MSDPTVRGSCLCGGVIFEMSPPYLFFNQCHCSRCRKSTGSAFGANILVKARQFRWLQGKELVGWWELPEAQYFCTGWCTTCGSTLPWKSRNGKGFLVPAGSLDDDPGAIPNSNTFWASRAPWAVDTAGLPTFDEGR
jgi:hypothetical protein